MWVGPGQRNFSLTGNLSDLQRSIQSFELGLAQDPFWPTNWATPRPPPMARGPPRCRNRFDRRGRSAVRPTTSHRFLITQGWMLEQQDKYADARRAYERAPSNSTPS